MDNKNLKLIMDQMENEKTMLRMLMNVKNITGRELAKLVNISPAAVSRFLKNDLNLVGDKESIIVEYILNK